MIIIIIIKPLPRRRDFFQPSATSPLKQISDIVLSNIFRQVSDPQMPCFSDHYLPLMRAATLTHVVSSQTSFTPISLITGIDDSNRKTTNRLRNSHELSAPKFKIPRTQNSLRFLQLHHNNFSTFSVNSSLPRY